MPDRKLRRVESRNDDYRAQIVQDGEGHDEHLQRGGNAVSENGQNAESKRDVGRHRNADSGLSRRPRIEREMNQRGSGHSAGGRDDRKKGVLEARELADVKFALELQSDEQEKDRHQSVVYPMLEAQASDIALPEIQILRADRGIRQRERERGADDQQIPARLLRVEKPVERARQRSRHHVGSPLTRSMDLDIPHAFAESSGWRRPASP